MTLDDIIKIVAPAYDPYAYEQNDDVIGRVYDEYKEFLKAKKTPKVPGFLTPVFKSTVEDTLAEFIVLELCDTYDPATSDREQLVEAASYMASAAEQCDRVTQAIEEQIK